MPTWQKATPTFFALKMGTNMLFDDLFSDFLPSSWFSTDKTTIIKAGAPASGGMRSYDSDSDELGMTLHVDLPGIDPKCINAEASPSNQIVVTASSTKKTFTNRYKLSDDFDAKTATATWSHGRLDIRVLRVKKSVIMKRIAIEIR